MNLNELRKLSLVGITYNQIESGVYALILQETDGQRRLPIIIGASEAQSIECRLQDVTPPRPLTHDLTVNIMRAYGLHMKAIEIKLIDGGIFAADIYLTDGERELTLDARSSDAIALAIRLGAPIFTRESVLSAVGIERRGEPASVRRVRKATTDEGLSALTSDRLEAMLADAVEKEFYEEAARIKTEIDRRKGGKGGKGCSDESSDEAE